MVNSWYLRSNAHMRYKRFIRHACEPPMRNRSQFRTYLGLILSSPHRAFEFTLASSGACAGWRLARRRSRRVLQHGADFAGASELDIGKAGNPTQINAASTTTGKSGATGGIGGIQGRDRNTRGGRVDGEGVVHAVPPPFLPMSGSLASLAQHNVLQACL